ncbi:MAG TPA: phage major capsid protein [Terriglobales bacterium]|jgi:HK97 family phage major capsid protein|nr:phage major capsid protein [Terriglobales bacterium]
MSQLSSAEQRASYIAQAQALLAKPDFSKEDRSKFDALMAMADAHTAEADNYRLHRLNSVLAQEGVQRVFVASSERSEVTKEIRRVLKGEVRTAMSVGTNNAGGYLVPAQFEKELILMQKAAGPLYADSELLTNIPTADGGPRVMPASDDLANEGYIQNENTVVTEVDPVLSQVSMHATTFSSGSVLVSNELVEDAFEAIENVLQRSLAARLSRAQNKQFLSSLLTTLAANSSAAVAAGGAAIAADDVHNLIYSVNAQYRGSQKCAFLLNSSTAKSIAALKDSNGRYIYQFIRDEAGVLSLEGFPVYFSDYCDNIASTKNPILFGDFSYIMLRHVPGITLQVLSQRYADQGSTAVIARKRADMQYAVPSTSDSAIKMLHFA